MPKRLSILTLITLAIASGWGEAPTHSAPTVRVGAYPVAQLTGFNIVVGDVNWLAVRPGESITRRIWVMPSGNGGYEVELGVLGLPEGITVSFSSNPVSVGQPVIMTLTAAVHCWAAAALRA